jgi:hypothetical protein
MALREAGIAACCLALAACSSEDVPPDVEIQVINGQGISQDSHLTVRVTTPFDTERRPFPFGDATDPNNWVIVHMPVRHGDLVEFALERGSDAGVVEVVKGTCGFDQPEPDHARAIITPLDLGAGRHLDCGEGFFPDNP